MPARRLPYYARRGEGVLVGLTLGQRKEWETAAEAAHMPLTDWIRRGGERPPRPRPEPGTEPGSEEPDSAEGAQVGREADA